MSKKKKNKNLAPRVPFNKPTFKPPVGTAMTLENMLRWVRGLNPLELEFIHMYAKETYAPIINNFDLCSTAALIQQFEGMSLEEIYEFQTTVTDLMREETEVEKELNKKGIDIMKNMKEIEPKIRKDIEKMLTKGVKSQKQAIEDLKMKYPTLSIASITNCYKKVKTDFKDKLDTEKAAEYILEDSVKEEPKKVVTVAAKEEITATVEDRKEEIKEIANRVDTLRVISKQIVVEGIYGQYTKNEDGVKFCDEYWTSSDAVRKDAAMKVEKLKEEIEKLEKEMDHITGKALELEQVFAM